VKNLGLLENENPTARRAESTQAWRRKVGVGEEKRQGEGEGSCLRGALLNLADGEGIAQRRWVVGWSLYRIRRGDLESLLDCAEI